MSKATLNQLLYYGIAVLSVVLATVLTLLLNIFMTSANLALFFAAVAFSARYGGLRPGIIATILSTLSIFYFFILQLDSLSTSLAFLLPLVGFVLVTLLFSSLRSELECARRQSTKNWQAQKQAEAEQTRLLKQLESNQRLLEAVLHQMPAALMVAEASHGQLVLMNPQVQQILRAEPDSFFNIENHNYHYQYFAASGRAYTPKEIPLARSLLTGEVIVGEEIKLLCGDGVIRTILASASPIRDSAGQILAAVTTFYDITERQQENEALRESEQQFRQLAETIHDVFWIYSSFQDRILYVSPAYELIWGFSCKDLYINPNTWMEAIHPEDRERVQTNFYNQMTQGKCDTQYRIICPNGSIRRIRERAFPIKNEFGDTYRVVGIAEDITELQETDSAFLEISDCV
jgi:PAS domain S-box-containing protein